MFSGIDFKESIPCENQFRRGINSREGGEQNRFLRNDFWAPEKCQNSSSEVKALDRELLLESILRALYKFKNSDSDIKSVALPII